MAGEWLPALEASLPGRDQPVLSVAEVTRLIKHLIESDTRLASLYVKGEISNFKHHSSGHMYFTLKDDRSRLKCVMFRTRNSDLRFRPEDGLTVVAGGSLGLYEVSGEYQLYVTELYPAGQGALWLAYEQLKRKLENEGLFAPERKRRLPSFPRTVGVVTSPTGAAIRDIISVIQRRCPTVRILLCPAIVQGAAGPPSVVQAIARVNAQPEVDVLIVGRGGGSIEELWTFNDESVARAIAGSRVPVISAVGHETDFTIADFVADHRAPTPSAAAEMAVPDQAELLRQVEMLGTRMQHVLKRRITLHRERLRMLTHSPGLRRPESKIQQRQQQVDELLHRASLAARHKMRTKGQMLRFLTGKLDSLSPLATLGRGYAICQRPNGQVVRRAADVSVGQVVDVRLAEGVLACQVRGVKGMAPVQQQLPLE